MEYLIISCVLLSLSRSLPMDEPPSWATEVVNITTTALSITEEIHLTETIITSPTTSANTVTETFEPTISETTPVWKVKDLQEETSPLKAEQQITNLEITTAHHSTNLQEVKEEATSLETIVPTYFPNEPENETLSAEEYPTNTILKDDTILEAALVDPILEVTTPIIFAMVPDELETQTEDLSSFTESEIVTMIATDTEPTPGSTTMELTEMMIDMDVVSELSTTQEINQVTFSTASERLCCSLLDQISTTTINKPGSPYPEILATYSTSTISSRMASMETLIPETTTQPRETRPKNLIKINEGLADVPEGYPEVQMLNLAYNNIQNLSQFVFWNNSYSGVQKLYLQRNIITTIHVNAFRGLRHINLIDLSDNSIASLDPYTFKMNNKLQTLILMNNNIHFDRLQTFILSRSIENLVLSGNRIDQIYEMTFLGVPNLRNLLLSDNYFYGIAPNSFKTLNKLQYLSLANTGVHRLGESMFSQVPGTINLEGTPLALKFEPPLKKVTGESIMQLLMLSRLMID